jgi:Sulfotransferase domain
MPVENMSLLQTVGADVRVVYLIRDPLARLWSHVRMIAHRVAPQRFADEALALFNRIIGGDLSGEGKGIVARGDYAAILPKLAQAIDPKRLLVMFYEDLISAPGVAQLSAFLGIAAGTADFERRVHRGVSLALPDTMTARAMACLRPQYDYVARQFGDIPTAWRANMGEGVA